MLNLSVADLSQVDLSRAERGTAPVFDRRVSAVVKAMTMKEVLENGDWNPNVREDYIAAYTNWINGSTVSPVAGLDQFPTAYFVNGVTQSYDIFFYEYKERRFRVLKGEYPYVRLSVNDWGHLEEEEIREHDAVVLSYPSYENGGVPRDFKKILDRCGELNVPVMIDAAYFGTCYDTTFDYSHPAITMLSFSLSKAFSIQSFRVGLLFSKHKLGYLEEIQVQAGYFNKIGAYVGMTLMQQFSADYMPETYRRAHRRVCDRLGLLPTHCIMLANVRNDDKRFDSILEDKRFEKLQLPEGAYRRVCISGYLGDQGSMLRRVAKKLLGRS